MAIKELTTSEIEILVGTRHETTGFEYPVNGLQPYYQWLVATLHLLAESSLGDLKVSSDDINDTTVRVASGRATINGSVLSYSSEITDLATFNNDITYIWLQDNTGIATIGQASASVGWPAVDHVKLAEVTISAGEITDILDRRAETIISSGLDAFAGGSFVKYLTNITVQGTVSTPSNTTITSQDIHGNNLNTVDYIRVRVCDVGSYGIATNATIASGVNTSIEDVFTSGKDVILKSHTDGTFNLQVTNTTAETVTLRIGSAPLSSLRGDYSNSLDVTHA